MKKLRLVEIFYSVQGEGANFGMPAIFIRFSNCNLNCSYCDTDWSHGKEYSIEELVHEVEQYQCKNIIWTGGEPTLQLNNEILSHFKGYYHCIETNGTNPVPSQIDYITCSPKVSSAVLRQNFARVDELRFPIAVGDKLPDVSSLPKAERYLVSPIFEGKEVNEENLIYCLNLIKNTPPWRLSIQVHKFLDID